MEIKIFKAILPSPNGFLVCVCAFYQNIPTKSIEKKNIKLGFKRKKRNLNCLVFLSLASFESNYSLDYLRQGGNVFGAVCLFVCVHYNSKSY